MATPEKAAVDVAEAAALTGLSKKALRRRIERGTLIAVKWGGKRMIPLSELRRQGLVANAEAEGSGAAPQREPHEMSSAALAGEGGQGTVADSVAGTGESLPPSPAPGEAAADALARELRATTQELERERLERERLERERLERERVERGRLAQGTESAGVPRTDLPGAAAGTDVEATPGRGTPVQGASGTPVAEAAPDALAPETQPLTGAVQPPVGVVPVNGLRYYWEEVRAIRVGAVLLMAGVIALLAWLLLRSDNGPAAIHAGGGPALVSQADLANLSSELQHTIYWAGAVPDTRLEVTLSDAQNVYVRYLTGSAQIGDPSPAFLTVGTYPASHAFEDLRAYARRSSATAKHVPGGGLAVPVPSSPTSVYLAYPQEELQIEVYDPQPGRALALVRSGGIQPVGGGPS